MNMSDSRGGCEKSPSPMLILVALAGALMFSMPMIPYLEQGSDINLHIEYARTIHQASDIVSPHFLFQILLIGIAQATSLDFERGTIFLMAACYAGMAAIIAQRIRNSASEPGVGVVFMATLGVLVASHIFAQTFFKFNFLYGYIAPVVYHNPTQVLCKILAVISIYAYFALAFDSRDEFYLKLMLPLSIVLSAIAKPSFLIAFLPCACLVELIRAFRGSWRLALRNIGLIAGPAIVALAFQFRMTYEGTGSGLGVAPFKVYGGALEVLTKLPASLLFPIAALVVLTAAGKVSEKLKFSWFLYAVGMLISLCVVETGPRLMHGNFAWTGQAVTFILYVESAIALVAISWRKSILAWIAFAIHVIFGAIWFATPYFMLVGTYW